MNFLDLLSPISAIFGMGKDYLANRALEKKTALDHKIRSSELRLAAAEDRVSKGLDADIAWESASLDNSGWKDEYLLILFSIPLILCFFPEGAVWVERGFEALKGTPDWYRYCLLLMVGGSYGSRKVLDFMKTKKGS